MSRIIPAFIQRRLPAWTEVFLALSVAAFLIFTWSLRELFFRVPSYSLSQTLGEILVITAYTLTFALLETLGVIFVLVAFAFVLPAWVLRDGFSYKAFFFILVSSVIFIHLSLTMTTQPRLGYLLEVGFIFPIWLALVLLARYVGGIRRIVLDLLDRLTIFSYLYLPLGILSMFVIAIRLLW